MSQDSDNHNGSTDNNLTIKSDLGADCKDARFLNYLEQVISERQKSSPLGSYTAKLFAAGPLQIAQKVGEEAVETVIAALGKDKQALANEAADLLYHLLVLLTARDVALADVITVLRERHQCQSIKE